MSKLLQDHLTDLKKLDESAQTEKRDAALKELIELGHQYISRIEDGFKPRLLFTEQGLSRLCHVLGYISGLAHAGQCDTAYAILRDLRAWLNYLENTDNNFEFELYGKQLTVPGRKCLMSDDGTWHGFGLLWYRPVTVDQFERTRTTLAAAYEAGRPPGNTDYFDTTAAAIKALNIREFVGHNKSGAELTEYRFAERNQIKVYYTQCMNGGFIYHGPGAGETFTVSLDNNKRFWGVHT